MKESDMETVDWLTSPVLDAAMTYHRMEKKLELEYKGQWVIIHGSQHIGEGFGLIPSIPLSQRPRKWD